MKIMTAPMAGITDYSFRKILSEFSPDVIFTEMIEVNALIYENKKTINEILKCDNNESVQIFGSVNDNFLKAISILIKRGFRKVDINLGCPMKKIVKNGKGSALLKETGFMKELIRKIKLEFKDEIELSIKIRIGYKDFDNPEYYVNLAKELDLIHICIHGRTQEQAYQGVADWDIIKNLKNKYKEVVIIGNGDLFTLEDIREKTNFSSVDGIMLARGILGNPWLIKQASEYFSNNIIKPAKIENIDRKNMLLKHINYYIENKGKDRAYLDMKKHIFWYLKDFNNIGNIKSEIINYKNIDDIIKYIVNNL